MGREIRRVDADWEHPKKKSWSGKEEGYQPVFDQDFDDAFTEWVENYNLWKAGEHPDQIEYPEEKDQPYWEWAGIPPNPEHYLPKPFTDPTWFQMYETVSEGTPVSPKFETAQELIDYLVANGDFWDQKRGSGGWNQEAAERFVGVGWAPSGVIIMTPEKSILKAPRDGI